MIAAIDIGSNSVRLAFDDGRTHSNITKLADGINDTGKLSPDGVQATIAVLKDYAYQTQACDKVITFATEAVRKAVDGNDFVEQVYRQTGLTVKVLSGNDEARLALMGAVKPCGAVTVCDLGGGSMELISSVDGVTPDYMESLPLGVVVLKNRYNGDYAKAIAEAPMLAMQYAQKPNYPLVAIGGSACALTAAILNLKVYDKEKINGAFITQKDIDGILPMLMSKHLPTLRPICAKRADTVAYGAIMLSAVANVLGLNGMYVSDAGNLDAVLSHPEFFVD